MLINCYGSLWSTADDGSGCFPLIKIIKPVSFYNDLSHYSFYEEKGRGMECKAFANAIINAAGLKVKYTDEIKGKIISQNILPSWNYMVQHYDDPAIVKKDAVPSEPKYSKSGNVIYKRTLIGYDKDKNPIYDYSYYTVISINSGDPNIGTVNSVQVKDNLGNIATLEGSELEKYHVVKYAFGIQYAEVGDMIFSTSNVPNGIDHAEIVVAINSGNSADGSVSSVDVVDSNFVGNSK